MTQRQVAFILTCLCVLVVAALNSLEFLQNAERYTQDVRVLARSKQQVPSDQICLITIDSKTTEHLEGHHFFWLKYYAQATALALEQGATSVGLDMVLTYPDEGGAKAMLGTAVKERGKIVLGTYLEPNTGELMAPFSALTAAAGAENLALLNLWQDPDGVVRSQPVHPIQLNALGRDSFPLFAGRLFELHTGESVPQSLALTDDGRFRIDFAQAEQFRSLSLQRVLELGKNGDSQQLSELFQGKVVMLGSLAPSDKDVVETPLSLETVPSPELSQTLSLGKSERRQSTPGLLVQAQVLSSLLQGRELREVTSPIWWLLVTLMASLTTVLVSVLRPTQASISIFAAAVFYGGGAYLMTLRSGELVPVVAVWLAMILVSVTQYAYRYGYAEREKRHLRSTFSRYVSDDVVEEMLQFPADYDPSGVTEREVTVMFSDINGFSTVCEGRTAVEITKMLNEHFREMSAIIFRNKGTLIRFNGDEFMVLFGAPRENAEAPSLAVKTALEMVARLEEMQNADSSGENGFYKVKIGIHTGSMILTSIGDEKRSDYNAIGDGANLASRVMSLAKQEGVPILVSEDVREKVGESPDIDFEKRGSYPVKGRDGEVVVYQPTFRKAAK